MSLKNHPIFILADLVWLFLLIVLDDDNGNVRIASDDKCALSFFLVGSLFF